MPFAIGLAAADLPSGTIHLGFWATQSKKRQLNEAIH